MIKSLQGMGLSKLDFDSSFCIPSYFLFFLSRALIFTQIWQKKCSERDWLRFLIHEIVPCPFHKQEISEGKGKLFKLTLRRVGAENRFIFYIPHLYCSACFNAYRKEVNRAVRCLDMKMKEVGTYFSTVVKE